MSSEGHWGEEEEEEQEEEHSNPTEVKMCKMVMPGHTNHRHELSVGQLLKWMDTTACLSGVCVYDVYLSVWVCASVGQTCRNSKPLMRHALLGTVVQTGYDSTLFPVYSRKTCWVPMCHGVCR